jgi:tetratricopeptide (TPR) repeat protein
VTTSEHPGAPLPPLAQAAAARVGREPMQQVHVVENHDAAYYIWRDAGLAQRVLLHIDAHHDMWWVEKRSDIATANFISPALQDGIVSEIVWVVPDDSWRSPETRRHVLRHLRKISSQYPDSSQPADAGDRPIAMRIIGKPLTVLPLSALQPLASPVLLDVDVDFFVIPQVSHGNPDVHSEVPWCWPGDLLSKLSDAGVQSDIATIAYSVDGNFTPLRWKYLGDELACRLRHPADATSGHPTSGRFPDAKIVGFDHMRAGAIAAHEGRTGDAERAYQKAADLLPESAAPLLHLARLYADIGRADQAHGAFRDAVGRDPTYHTPYHNAAFKLYQNKRFAEAEREFQSVLQLDPDDAYALLGLGQIARRRKQWTQAEPPLRRALDRDPDLIDAHRDLGEVLIHRRQLDEATHHYEACVSLALGGHRSLESVVGTRTDQPRILDSCHGAIHVRLGRLYARRGFPERAISEYRMGAATGNDGVTLRLALAMLFLRTGNLRAAVVESGRALAKVPSAIAQFWKRGLRRAKITLSL